MLASCSPRRAALLSEAGFEFETVAPRVAEKFDLDLTLRELTMWNAIRKGVPVARAYPDKIILAADTLIALEDEIIGKPADLTEAAQILRRLSGRTHEVCSAVKIVGSFSNVVGLPMEKTVVALAQFGIRSKST